MRCDLRLNLATALLLVVASLGARSAHAQAQDGATNASSDWVAIMYRAATDFEAGYKASLAAYYATGSTNALYAYYNGYYAWYYAWLAARYADGTSASYAYYYGGYALNFALAALGSNTGGWVCGAIEAYFRFYHALGDINLAYALIAWPQVTPPLSITLQVRYRPN